MALADIQHPESVLAAIHEFDELGREAFLKKYGFGRAREFFLVWQGNRYDSKAVVGAAHGFEFPLLGPLKWSEFSGGYDTVKTKLEALGFKVEATSLEPHKLAAVEQERSYREDLWRKLQEHGGPRRVAPKLVHDLGMYRGQRGIWPNKARTEHITSKGHGVTLAVLHRGHSYADDLSDDGVIYHYCLNPFRGPAHQPCSALSLSGVLPYLEPSFSRP